MLNERRAKPASTPSAERERESRFGTQFSMLVTVCAFFLGALAVHRHFDVEPYFTITLVATGVVVGVFGCIRRVRSDDRRLSNAEHEPKGSTLTPWQVVAVVGTLAVYFAAKLLLLGGR